MTRSRLVGGIVALVVLAAGALALRPPPAPPTPAPPPPPADRTDLPALPPHVLNVALGPIDLTADAGADPHGPTVIVMSGDELEIIVRPERELPRKVAVKVFWRKNQKVKRWHPPTEYGPHSTHRFRGPSERPFGRGPGKIIAVVSPVADVPDELPPGWLDTPPRHWQVLQQTIRWR